MSVRPALLTRLERRLEEQEVASAIKRAVTHCQLHGLTFDEQLRAEFSAGIAAYARHKRDWPRDLDLEEQIRRAAAWWADWMGLPPEEVIAEAERLAEECTKECPHE